MSCVSRACLQAPLLGVSGLRPHLVPDKTRVWDRDVEEEAAEHKFAAEHLDAAAEASSDEQRDAKDEKMAE